MNITNPELWKRCTDNNQDSYGKGINDYAERWANLMETRLASGESLADIALPTSFEADTDGITGFMFGAAVATLVEVWEHGAALRTWHNSRYDYTGEGTVNPALITVQIP